MSLLFFIFFWLKNCFLQWQGGCVSSLMGEKFWGCENWKEMAQMWLCSYLCSTWIGGAAVVNFNYVAHKTSPIIHVIMNISATFIFARQDHLLIDICGLLALIIAFRIIAFLILLRSTYRKPKSTERNLLYFSLDRQEEKPFQVANRCFKALFVIFIAKWEHRSVTHQEENLNS